MSQKLTTEQQHFVRNNHQVLTTGEMSKSLNVKRYIIEKFMHDNRLETLSISLSKPRKSTFQDSIAGMFNYNLPHDTTWLV